MTTKLTSMQAGYIYTFTPTQEGTKYILNVSPVPTTEVKPSRLTPQGRQRVSDAQRKRWALVKRAKAKAAKAAVRATSKAAKGGK